MINIALRQRQSIGDWLNELKRLRADFSDAQGTFFGRLTEQKSVVILIDLADSKDLAVLNTLRKGLQTLCPNAQQTLLCLCSEKSVGDTLISDNHKEYFTEKDFSFFFKIKNLRLLEHLKKEYDVAVVLNSSKSTLISFVARYVKAKLCVGVADSIDNEDKVLNYTININGAEEKSPAALIVESLQMMFGNNK